MKYTRSKWLAALSLAVLGAASAEATPGFARQMNMDCMSCHSQQLPMLNSFGRQFKLSSFSMVAGDQPEITDMELIRNINMGVGFKGLVQSSERVDDRSDTPGTGYMPEESAAFPSGIALLLGGRVGEGMGVNMLFTNTGVGHLQASISKPLTEIEGRVGLALFGTSGHGAFIGTESYNTGLHKELGMFANADLTNAAQATGAGKGAATGVNVFYGGYGLTASIGVAGLGFNSNMSNTMPSMEGGLNKTYRLSYDLPTMAGWDLSLGAYGIQGTTRGTNANLFDGTANPLLTLMGTDIHDVKLDVNGFDMQLMGDITNDIHLQVLGQYVAGYKMSFTNLTTNVTRTPKDQKAMSLEAQLMMWKKFGIRTAYLKVDDKQQMSVATNNDYSVLSFGLQYNLASNVNFAIEHASIDNDNKNFNATSFNPEEKRLTASTIIVF